MARFLVGELPQCGMALALAAALAACAHEPPPYVGWTDPTTGVRVVVEAVDAHPLLRDHGRQLCIVSARGRVSRIPLHPDNGLGVPCNLYRLDEQRLLVVDCDGVWVTIDATGAIESRRWCWLRELPREFVGSFRVGDDRVYRLEPGAEPEVYLLKDPPDGVPGGG